MATVLAFFYLWYSVPGNDGGHYTHWNHTVLPHWTQQVNDKYSHINFPFKPDTHDPHDPLAGIHSRYYPLNGPYSSGDPGQLQTQFTSMAKAKIDVAVASWWGRPEVSNADSQGTHTDSKFKDVLKAAHEADVKVAFLMEPYAGRDAQTFVADVEYINERYASHPACYKIRDELVFYVYDSYHIGYRDWADVVMPKIRDMGYYIGLVLKRGDIGGLSKGGESM